MFGVMMLIVIYIVIMLITILQSPSPSSSSLLNHFESHCLLHIGNHAIRLYICSVKYFEEISEVPIAAERSYKWKDCDAIVQTDYLRTHLKVSTGGIPDVPRVRFSKIDKYGLCIPYICAYYLNTGKSNLQGLSPHTPGRRSACLPSS